MPSELQKNFEKVIVPSMSSKIYSFERNDLRGTTGRGDKYIIEFERICHALISRVPTIHRKTLY